MAPGRCRGRLMRRDPVYMDAIGILWVGIAPLAARVVAGKVEHVAPVILPIPGGRSLAGQLPKRRVKYAGKSR